MLISTRGRYALRVMLDLAEHSSESFIPLGEIARRQQISVKYLEMIVKILVRGRMVESLRGKGGGYRLRKAPAEYTVDSILSLTEDSLAPVACLGEGAEACQRSGECRTLSLWQGLDRTIHSYLQSVTLADLMRPGALDEK